jgi:SAM-dependent methyltransferase
MPQPDSFLSLLEDCRQVYAKNVSGFSRKGADFDSVVYAEGLRKDLGKVKKYVGDRGLIGDFGCGKGHVSVLLNGVGFEVVGLDIPELTGEFSNLSHWAWQKRIWREFIQKYSLNYNLADIQNLPLKDGVFDGAVMYAVIEHISKSPVEIQKMLSEVHRTLKPGGYLFIFRCPNKNSYAEKIATYLKLPKHDKLYSDAELKKLVSKDFEILEFQRTDMILAFVPFMKVWNRLSRNLLVLDGFLLKTPFKLFSHHMLIVCQKKQRGTK